MNQPANLVDHFESWYTFRSLGTNRSIGRDINVARLAVEVSRERIPMPALNNSIAGEVLLEAIDLYVCEFRRSAFLQVHLLPTYPCFKIVVLADRGEGQDLRSFESARDCLVAARDSDMLTPFYVFIRVLEQQVEISKGEESSLLDKIDTQIGLEVSPL